MKIRTWLTQPPGTFSSYYYYNTETRDFIRIRLALNRGDKGDPKIMFYKNRYVAFVRDEKYKFEKPDLWSGSEGKINYTEVLPGKKVVGYKTVDFSLSPEAEHPAHVHHGHAVVNEPIFPQNKEGQLVTEAMLKVIAKHYVKCESSKTICPYNATEQKLGDALFVIFNSITV